MRRGLKESFNNERCSVVYRRRPRRPPFLRVLSEGMGVTSSAGRRKPKTHCYLPEVPQETNGHSHPTPAVTPTPHSCPSWTATAGAMCRQNEHSTGAKVFVNSPRAGYPGTGMLRKQKSPSPIPVKPSSHSVSKETEAARYNFQISQHNHFSGPPSIIESVLNRD